MVPATRPVGILSSETSLLPTSGGRKMSVTANGSSSIHRRTVNRAMAGSSSSNRCAYSRSHLSSSGEMTSISVPDHCSSASIDPVERTVRLPDFGRVVGKVPLPRTR